MDMKSFRKDYANVYVFLVWTSTRQFLSSTVLLLRFASKLWTYEDSCWHCIFVWDLILRSQISVRFSS